MRGITLAVLALLPTAALAEDWQKLSGESLRTTLAGHGLLMPDNGATMQFGADGKGIRNFEGKREAIRWQVEGDRLCVSDAKRAHDCLQVARRGDQLRLTDPQGRQMVMRYTTP